jgi:hypothetical protein
VLGRVKITATGKLAIGVVALPATGIAPDRRAADVAKIEAAGLAFAVEELMRDGYCSGLAFIRSRRKTDRRSSLQ